VFPLGIPCYTERMQSTGIATSAQSFPHNIGPGPAATRPGRARGAATAEELIATGVNWSMRHAAVLRTSAGAELTRAS
jgi:beta-glucosidase-like glycosyl hydrolase